MTTGAARLAPACGCYRPFGQPKARQRHTSEADPEFLQRRAARDRLGHAPGEFIEFIVHLFPSV
jgi:hypothetical protein